MARRAARVDNTQSEIVSALRQVGCFVQSLAAVGRGVPDLLVCVHPMSRVSRLYLLECKTNNAGLTDAETAFCHLWPVSICRTPEEALSAVGLTVEGEG